MIPVFFQNLKIKHVAKPDFISIDCWERRRSHQLLFGRPALCWHYNDIMMSAMASQITSLTIVYSTFHSGTDQRKQQSSASLAFVWGIHRWSVNSLHKAPVRRKMFSFDDVILESLEIEVQYRVSGSSYCSVPQFWRNLISIQIHKIVYQFLIIPRHQMYLIFQNHHHTYCKKFCIKFNDWKVI